MVPGPGAPLADKEEAMGFVRGGLAAAAVLAAAVAARADDIRVPQDYRTIQQAVDAARPGDRVLVSRGRHRGPVVVSANGIEIVGNGARLVAPRARRSHTEGDRVGPAMLVRAHYVTVRGLTFERGGLVVLGDGASIEDNTFQPLARRGNWEGTALRVEGDGAAIRANTVDAATLTWGTGISVVGNGAVVEGNQVTDVTSGIGILVTGGDFVVSGNTLEGIGAAGGDGYCPGIYVDNAGGDVEGGLVEGNAVRHGPTAGFVVAGRGIVLRGNTDEVLPEGRSGEWTPTGFVIEGDVNVLEGNTSLGGGFTVVGDGNTVTGNHAVGTVGNGFTVDGDGNSLEGDDVDGSDEEGIQILEGAGNAVDGCSATGCASCGLGNWGTDTSVTGSTFLGNGVDFINGGTLTVFEGNVFETSDNW